MSKLPVSQIFDYFNPWKGLRIKRPFSFFDLDGIFLGDRLSQQLCHYMVNSSQHYSGDFRDSGLSWSMSSGPLREKCKGTDLMVIVVLLLSIF